MKKILYFLGPLFITFAAAFGVYYWFKSLETPGYVLIGIGHWSVETTLAAFAVGLIIGFFYFMFFSAFSAGCSGCRACLKTRHSHQIQPLPGSLDRRSCRFGRRQLEQAEKVLIKHASHSGAPLIHYLTAARAAQSRGAFDKRDEYLQKPPIRLQVRILRSD